MGVATPPFGGRDTENASGGRRFMAHIRIVVSRELYKGKVVMITLDIKVNFIYILKRNVKKKISNRKCT